MFSLHPENILLAVLMDRLASKSMLFYEPTRTTRERFMNFSNCCLQWHRKTQKQSDYARIGVVVNLHRMLEPPLSDNLQSVYDAACTMCVLWHSPIPSSLISFRISASSSDMRIECGTTHAPLSETLTILRHARYKNAFVQSPMDSRCNSKIKRFHWHSRLPTFCFKNEFYDSIESAFRGLSLCRWGWRAAIITIITRSVVNANEISPELF